MSGPGRMLPLRRVDLIPAARTTLAVLALATSVACGTGGPRHLVPAGTGQPDVFLHDKGKAALDDKKWATAREYFKEIVDNYPQSPLRPEAKLGLGDSYLNEGTTESYVLATNEFKEFLTFYPTNARADYAQFHLALTHYKQMRAPERDQSETKEALKEFDAFFERYPSSPLMPDVKAKWRETRDRLSEAAYRVGLFYFRNRWYPGAIDRFRQVLKDDPGYTARDAVYFYLAESLVKTDNKAEALPYFEKLTQEFDKSVFLEDAKRRIGELKIQ